jgi:hypothetical protein
VAPSRLSRIAGHKLSAFCQRYCLFPTEDSEAVDSLAQANKLEKNLTKMSPLTCSICKKKITNFKRYLEIGYGFPQPEYRLCAQCGKPVIELLEKHGLKSFAELVRPARRP